MTPDAARAADAGMTLWQAVEARGKLPRVCHCVPTWSRISLMTLAQAGQLLAESKESGRAMPVACMTFTSPRWTRRSRSALLSFLTPQSDLEAPRGNPAL